MARVYLEPSDIDPIDAKRILDTLNGAASAEALDEAIELAGQPDIGVRLARRLLRQRDAVGGFVRLEQILDTPLIGPERFTDMVVAIVGQRAATGGLRLDLLQELEALKAQVAALSQQLGQVQDDRPRVTLRVLQPLPLFGQPVNLVATVTAADGETPLVQVPVTLTTTLGRFRVTGIDGPTEHTALTAMTNSDGVLRVVLVPPASEGLEPVSQHALELALRRLDTSAPTPRDASSGFKGLVQSYREPGGDALRQAVDRYFQDFGQGWLEGTMNLDALAAWSWREAAVLACVHAAAAPGDPQAAVAQTVVHGTAAMVLRFFDWLGPFFQTWAHMLEEEEKLEADLRDTLRLVKDEGRMLGRIFSHVRDFVDEQPGRIGQQLGKRAVERSLRAFAVSGLSSVSQATVTALLTGLEAATSSVQAGGSAGVVTLGVTRAELDRTIDRSTLEQGMLAGQLADLRELVNTRVDLETFTAYQAQVGKELEDKLARATFEPWQQQVTIELQNRIDISTFSAYQAEVSESLATKLDEPAMKTYQDQLQLKLNQINTDVMYLKKVNVTP